MSPKLKYSDSVYPFGEFDRQITTVDDRTLVWRYFDWPKFLSFVSKRSLYLSRSDLLGDRWEGAPPKMIYDIVRSNSKQVVEFLNTSGGPNDVGRFVQEIFQKLRASTYVSCWHINEVESAAMWSKYGRESGLAIKCRVESLRKIAGPGMFLGNVRYIDHLNIGDAKERNDIREIFFMKRRSFEFERELRLIKVVNHETKELAPEGFEIPVDPNALIEGIYVSPEAQDWYPTCLRTILAKLDITAPLEKSGMNDLPVV